MAELAIESPFAAATEVILNSGSDWTIGTLSGNQSVTNILKNPLLQKFAIFDHDVNHGRKSSLDINFVDYPQELSGMSSHKLQKEATVLDHRYTSAPVHKRIVSMSSTNSSCSDQSSSSTFCSSFQGMMQCTWKDGLAHHVFTVDDKREVYVANSSKVESSKAKDLDYVYFFHSRKNDKKECDIQELESEKVGKMQVSTNIRFCFNNSSEIRETRFILSACDDNLTEEMQTSIHTLRKNKRMTRKVGDVFRSYKQRPSSKFEASSAISEDTLWEPAENIHNHLGSLDAARAESELVPNLELAAILVKETCKNHKDSDLGGWGLKFLKKTGNSASLETLMPPECARNAGDCSTSMDVVIPAGFHGGPRIGVGGPSSLIERWISGGRCDCGGWDIGCPLTILNTKSCTPDSSSEADDSRECKSVDLFMQGSKQDSPIMKMVNIHDGLYYIHFQSTLSTLQSFGIAVAIIHSQSPALRFKVC